MSKDQSGTESLYDVIVIGGGPGGYVCAIKAAQLGLKTAIVEKDQMGGVCLNVGCIPSKALIHAGHLVTLVQSHAAEIGIQAEYKGLDLTKTIAWKNSVVKKLTGGVQGLLKANKVEIFSDEAEFVDTKKIKLKKSGQTLGFRHAVIATGSKPAEIPGFAFDGQSILNSSHALDLTQAPARLAVIGGGYIGLELGSYLQKIGSKVTIFEGSAQPLATMDPDCVNVVIKKLGKLGVQMVTQAQARKYEKTKEGLKLTYQTPQGEQSGVFDKILVTVGRKPLSDQLGLEKAGVRTDARGFVPVDRKGRTNVPHIFAIGDVAGGTMLAHKASREGIIAAEVISGKNSQWDALTIPAVVFTDPEIASVGYTEKEAREKGFETTVGQFPFAALGKALAQSESEGFVKIIAEKETHKLLGVHIVGYEASSLLGEAGLALEMGALLEDLAATIHAHPTLPEALMECAEVALGHPIHVLPKR